MADSNLSFTGNQIIALVKASNVLIMFTENYIQTEFHAFEDESAVQGHVVESSINLLGSLMSRFNFPEDEERLIFRQAALMTDAQAFSILGRMGRAKKRAVDAFLNMFMHLDKNAGSIKISYWEKLCLKAKIQQMEREEAKEILGEFMPLSLEE